MHSKIIKTLLLSMILFFFLTGIAAAQEWVVTSPGDTERVNVTLINLDHMTLREALAQAGAGDTIVFDSNVSQVNVIYGSLNISKDLTLGGNTQVTVRRDPSSVTRELTVFNVTGGNVTFNNLTIENGRLSNGRGGAVFVDRANVTLNFCTLQRNTADFGGAIYASNSSTVKLVSSALFRNNATTDGSAVYLNNSRLEMDNTVIQSHSGGNNTVRLDQGKIIAAQTRFIDNEIRGHGSPLNASAGTIVEFRNSTFSNNTATESAGMTIYGTVLAENCVFDGGRTTGAGGGIALKNGSVGTIRYSVFSNSNASEDGGGVHIDVDSIATIDTCTFIHNLANYGGAFFNRGTLNVTSSTIVNNTAKYYGGGAALWNDGNATVTKTIFAANTARSNNTARDVGGGGVNISNSQALLSNNIIVGNTDPRNVDLSEHNASVRSGGNNLVDIYNGNGRYPIEASDAAGIQMEDVFVIENGLPSLTRTTGHTAGYDRVPLYTVALNSSRDNPAADVLGTSNQTPVPVPPQDNQTNNTPEPAPPEESGGWRKYLMYGVIGIVLIIILAVAVVAYLRYREKNQYKFG